MLEEAELGEFLTKDKTLGCYFKCVMEKGGAVKEILFFCKNRRIIIKIGSLKLKFLLIR